MTLLIFLLCVLLVSYVLRVCVCVCVFLFFFSRRCVRHCCVWCGGAVTRALILLLVTARSDRLAVSLPVHPICVLDDAPHSYQVVSAFDDMLVAKRMIREIRLLRQFDHDNIIRIVDMLPPPSVEKFKDVYMVLDRMDTVSKQ